MKKFCVPAVVLAATVLLGGTASAATFTLESYSVIVNTADPGLKVIASPMAPGGYTTPDLQVGESHTFELFYLQADESAINPDDLTGSPISVQFAFNPPLAGGPLGGATVGGSFNLACLGAFCIEGQYAEVSWNNPLVLNFGKGGQFTLELENAVFASGVNSIGTPVVGFNGAPISATLTYVTAVPEPATLVLLGTGILGIGVRRFRR